MGAKGALYVATRCCNEVLQRGVVKTNTTKNITRCIEQVKKVQLNVATRCCNDVLRILNNFNGFNRSAITFAMVNQDIYPFH
jgi:hypothetical protein